PVPAGWIVDATLGGAGHATALLESRPDLSVLGLDRDPNALVAAQARLAPWGDRTTARLARFDQLCRLVAEAGAAIQPIVGVLFDLGVSSPQFDDPERGFSYRHAGPIDMRMSAGEGPSAAEVVNGASVAELAAILRDNADERHAGRIARAIVAARPLHTTTELAEVVVAAIPAPARRRGGYPAKRTFAALRIHVNEELTQLGPALDAAIDVLAPGGRLVAISYHSGEDRIVKAGLRAADDGGCTCPPGLPCGCGALPQARLLRRGGWTPDAAEMAANPRSASARLRAVLKLPTTPSEDSP
ncbi:MAG: 16S rRNA (cytosine(1402)-N(4))-methyltransferase RsmH, partial [Acidimicrobiales bacterium]